MARTALRAIGRPDAELSVVLTDDASIRDLNARHRRTNRATDVLSFSLVEGPYGDLHDAIGDVVISVETARRQAAERGWPLESEVARLLVHGILHLLGWDHERSPAEARRMRRKENEVLDAIALDLAGGART